MPFRATAYYARQAGELPLPAPAPVSVVGPSEGAVAINSQVTNPFSHEPFVGAWTASPAPLVSPSMMNTPPGLVTQDTAANIQAEVNSPTGFTQASALGDVDFSKVPAWAWLTLAGFAAYLFMGKKSIHVGFAHSRSPKRKRRRR